MNLRSKNELAKRISHPKLNAQEARVLIDNCIKNHDQYWVDNIQQSKPAKGKYVRDASRTPLGKLLELIDRRVLAPHDALIPAFIYGGLKGRDSITAGFTLLGNKRNRRLASLDIATFFEQVHYDRIVSLLRARCHCSDRVARLIARLCCVHIGSKNEPGREIVLARGFATSTRLAVWSCMDHFIRLYWMVGKKLKGKDPRIAIYIDDIGISASRVSEEEMKSVIDDARTLLMKYDNNLELPLNEEKTDNAMHGQAQHLGMRIGRSKLAPGWKTAKKRAVTAKRLAKSPEDAQALRSMKGVKAHIRRVRGKKGV